MVVGDEIQLGPRSCTFNVCGNESCKKNKLKNHNYKLKLLRAFFGCSEFWTVSRFNSFILITYLTYFILLSRHSASPLAQI